MTQKLSGEERQDNLTWDESISRYLKDHPDYFLRHPDILTVLTVPHHDSGGAISLIEHQLRLLREQNKQYGKQLHELISIARDNDSLGHRLHRYALAMIACKTLDAVLDTSKELLLQEFSLDAVVIMIRGDDELASRRQEFVGADDQHFSALLKRFEGKREMDSVSAITPLHTLEHPKTPNSRQPICGGKYDEAMMGFLFGDRACEIKSSAVVPLGESHLRGALCLGSSDPNRFHSGMGTDYLIKLGDLLLHCVDSHLH